MKKIPKNVIENNMSPNVDFNTETISTEEQIRLIEEKISSLRKEISSLKEEKIGEILLKNVYYQPIVFFDEYAPGLIVGMWQDFIENTYDPLIAKRIVARVLLSPLLVLKTAVAALFDLVVYGGGTFIEIWNALLLQLPYNSLKLILNSIDAADIKTKIIKAKKGIKNLEKEKKKILKAVEAKNKREKQAVEKIN